MLHYGTPIKYLGHCFRTNRMLTRSWKLLVCEKNPSLLNFPDYRISKHTGEIRRGVKPILPHYRARDAARIALYNAGTRKNILVHRAYLLVFHGQPPKDEQERYFTGDHINRNHLDNTPTNLRWLSIREQNMHGPSKKRYVKYTDEFSLYHDERIATYPSRHNVWQFTTYGRILFNGKLRYGGRPRRDGYFAVTIDKKQLYVHRIIAHLFLGYDIGDSESVIMHLDHDKTNCHVDNLRIGTHAQNMQAEANRRKAN